MAIPDVDGAWKLTQKVQASFEIPQVRCQVLQVDDYSVPPAPNASIGRHSCQFQTLSCLVKTTGRDNHRRPWLMPRPFSIGLRKPNCQFLVKGTFLARFVQELRQAMRPFTTFSYHAVLEGAVPYLGYPEEEAAQPNTTLKEQTPWDPHSTNCSTIQ